MVGVGEQAEGGPFLPFELNSGAVLPVDDRDVKVGSKGDQKITESHLSGKYVNITLIPRQYPDIPLVAEQYKIYCPALAFDLST